MGGQELLVGVGDSSFGQLPRPLVILPRHIEENSSNEHNGARIHAVSCGSTAAFAVSSHGSLLEWGTGVYGERLSPGTKVPPGDDVSATAAETPPLDHPAAVVLPIPLPPVIGMKPPAVKLIACGAHFVVAALESGGCVSWGGGRDARRSLGRGGCGTCGPCSSSSPSTPVAPPLTQSCSGGTSKPDWVSAPLGPGGLTVNDLAAGDNHAIAVCGNGKAWAWGSGECGQLGSISPEGDRAGGGGACVPMSVRVPPTAVVRAAACGRDHSAVLTGDGRVWTFGSSLHGQLGLGSVGGMSWTPAVVDALDGVGTMRMDGSFTGMASVSCGAWHTAALSTTGDVYAWGWARFGALGPSPPGNEPSHGRKPQGASGGGDSGVCGEGVNRSSDVDTNGVPGCKRNAGEIQPTTAATAQESQEGEVRPYPGLVDGIDALLLDGGGGGDDEDDDRLVSVSCGARYTLALSRKRRAFVWGQVEPPKDNGGAGGRKADPSCGSGRNGSNRGTGDGNAPLAGSYSTPRELIPEELLRDAAAAAASAKIVDGVGDTDQSCCCRKDADGATLVDKNETGIEGEGDVRQQNGADSGSRWRISAAGCGPWYIVIGLEEEDRHPNRGRRHLSGKC